MFKLWMVLIIVGLPVLTGVGDGQAMDVGWSSQTKLTQSVSAIISQTSLFLQIWITIRYEASTTMEKNSDLFVYIFSLETALSKNVILKLAFLLA